MTCTATPALSTPCCPEASGTASVIQHLQGSELYTESSITGEASTATQIQLGLKGSFCALQQALRLFASPGRLETAQGNGQTPGSSEEVTDKQDQALLMCMLQETAVMD